VTRRRKPPKLDPAKVKLPPSAAEAIEKATAPFREPGFKDAIEKAAAPLRDTGRQVEQAREAAAREAARPLPGPSPEQFAAAKFERDVAVYEEALARHDRRQAGRARRSAKQRGRKNRKGVGAPEAFYDRDEIKRAVELWRGRDSLPQEISQTSIARPGFPRTAVRRALRLDEHGAFELGPRGGLRLLGIDGEFRAAAKKVSLRALERTLGLEPLT
jgi:hypothetical protein